MTEKRARRASDYRVICSVIQCDTMLYNAFILITMLSLEGTLIKDTYGRFFIRSSPSATPRPLRGL